MNKTEILALLDSNLSDSLKLRLVRVLAEHTQDEIKEEPLAQWERELLEATDGSYRSAESVIPTAKVRETVNAFKRYEAAWVASEFPTYADKAHAESWQAAARELDRLITTESRIKR